MKAVLFVLRLGMAFLLFVVGLTLWFATIRPKDRR